jgi:hypothetical protein
VPSLIHIIIERDCGKFQPVSCFPNGHRAVMRAKDFCRFCVRLPKWGLDSLCSALVSEGRVIYGHMIGACELHDDVVDKEHHRLRQPGAGPVHVDTASRLQHWWIPQWAIRHLLPSNLFTDRDTNARGARLLIENLSQVQRDQYERRGYFEVTGGGTGKRYRIRKSYQMNVEELSNNGRRMSLLCFMPKGGLVLADVMLAQKLALELFELEALAIANTCPGQYHYSPGLLP